MRARLALCLALASAVALGALACGGDDPAPPPYRAALAGPTAEPTPSPEPGAEPAPSPELTPPASGLLRRVDAHGYRGLITYVPGGLLTAAWLDHDRMYVADMQGRIQLVDVRRGRRQVVLEGLVNPQGLTVLDGRLYVTDMGNACAEIDRVTGRTTCSTPYLDMEFGVVVALLSRISSRILSYDIDGAGRLSGQRIVADRIMSISRDHSPNGLANDGEYVYVSIGHPEVHVHRGTGGLFIEAEESLAAAGRRTDLMGVVARFRPQEQDTPIEVYATGFRNVYGISIGPGGVIWGADNDQHSGLTAAGHREELNAITQGSFYGFPFWGTYEAPPGAGVTEPVAVLQGTGSSEAYANEDGVYVAYISLDPQGQEQDGFVIDRFDYETWTPSKIFKGTESFIVDILERDGLLYVLEVKGHIHVIDPRDAPIDAIRFDED